MMGLWVTDVWEQTSHDGVVGHCRVGADVMLWGCGSLMCGSRRHVMGLWITDVWEQTSRYGAVGH